VLTGVPLRSSGCEELCHSALSSQVLPELALPKSYAALYDKMLELYPKRVNPLPLWLSAHSVKA
jgi:hypothetical protein